jgi:hypothetical protein
MVLIEPFIQFDKDFVSEVQFQDSALLATGRRIGAASPFFNAW